MKFPFIIFIILIEKTEMPQIRKKYPANGRSKYQANEHHWFPKHSSFYKFHNTELRSNKQKTGHKLKDLQINDKLQESFRFSGKRRLFNHIRNKHVNKHSYGPLYPMKYGIIDSKPSYQHLSRQVSEKVRNNFNFEPSFDYGVKANGRSIAKNIIPFSDSLRKKYEAEIKPGMASHVGGMLIRSEDEDEYDDKEENDDVSSQSKQSVNDNNSRKSPVSEEEDYAEEGDYDDEEDYDDKSRKPSKFVSGNKPSTLPILTEKKYSDISNQPQLFAFGSRPSNPPNAMTNMNQQLYQLPVPNPELRTMTSMIPNQPMSVENESRALAALPGGNRNLQLPYPPFSILGTIFQQQPVVFPDNKDLTASNPGFNLPNQVNGLLFNQPAKPGEMKSNFPTMMEVMPKVGEDLIRPSFLQPINAFHEQGSSRAKQMNALHQNISGSALRHFQDKLERWKIPRRSGDKNIFLYSLVIFMLISVLVILAAITYCKYRKDVMKKYPKRKTALTFLGVSKQQQRDLLKRIGSIKKYDYLNTEEFG